MNDKAYDYMDWPQIENVVYSEVRDIRPLLAPKKVKEGILYQCFLPGRKEVLLRETRSGKEYPMALESEEGWFAIILPHRHPMPHMFVADEEVIGDPYAYENTLDTEMISRFEAGIGSRVYRMMGASKKEVDGVEGVSFVLWAPNALRASVVGPFNKWDGRVYPMQFHEESGLFELFLPGIEEGTEYNYELLYKGGDVSVRTDPYARAYKKKEDGSWVSIYTESSFRWHDRSYLETRSRRTDTTHLPMCIYECSLAAWAKKTGKTNYRTLADVISTYVEDMGYSEIELMPIMEYPEDSSNGYQTGGYFAPTCRYGDPDDFKYFVDSFHAAGIGVFMDWTPAQFTADRHFLAGFDGTCLYEHLDPRQGIHPLWGSCIYNYGRPEVRSFLLSSASFWTREYHIDGLRLDGCSPMLRLDYARGNNWVANMYGSNENLEGIDFLKTLSSLYKREYPDCVLMIEEDVDWPEVTSPIEEDGLGFDYKWNLHFTQDMLSYFGESAEGKRTRHNELLNGMLNHYFDRFILSYSRGIGPFDKKLFLDKIDGDEKGKVALTRAAYVYLMTHPGKKLIATGEDWQTAFFRDLVHLYSNEPALFIHDFEEAGFEWINTMDSEHSILSYMRIGEKKDQLLIAVCNFSDTSFDDYRVGVPYKGTYRQILNTEDVRYGGDGVAGSLSVSAENAEWDERPYSISFGIARRSAVLLHYEYKKDE
ncbi:MAG: 1,4-alpha-glucan branching enzyme [Lachnospiraceae bacterium]|nr:1,4-alpha-glucan branching enzyme [Lachnospiraceae bacterium]